MRERERERHTTMHSKRLRVTCSLNISNVSPPNSNTKLMTEIVICKTLYVHIYVVLELFLMCLCMY